MNTKTTRHSSTPKQVFLHLLLMGMLYMGVISLIQLLFVYIDLIFVDPLKYTDYWSVSSSYGTIRWTSSVMIVCAPVYIALSRFLYQGFSKDPELQHVWIRRWLLSLTLFIAAITMIGSLISVVYNFYSGDLTIAFACKVLVLMLISAAIFGYYRWDMKRDMTTKTSLARNSAVVTALSIIVIIVVGFFIAGSPMQQRNVRFDEQRITDLQSIQSQIIEYYRQKETLPDTLSQLTSSLYGYTVPTDPETDTAYEYSMKSALSFELCATFATDGRYSVAQTRPLAYFDGASTGYRAYTDQWEHTAERVCFTRTLDPEYFTVTSPSEVK